MIKSMIIALAPIWRRVRAHWGKLVSHEGRMSRRQLAWHMTKAYGYFVLFGLLALVPPQIAFHAWPMGFIWTLALPWMMLCAALAFISFVGIASAGLTRRCHDVGLPGWWIFMSFPLVMPGDEKPNAYGPPPEVNQAPLITSVPIVGPRHR